MSFSSSWSKFIQGISVDPLKPAKANLFITVLDESFSKKLFQQENSFVVNNPNQILPSLQELNDEIIKNFREKSLVIDESLTNKPSIFKNLYENDIIVEILFTSGNKPEVYSRSRRDTDEPAKEQPKGLVEPNKNDQIIALNLCIWTTFFIFVVVLFTSYSIWYMDPGFDSIIYKTTNYRIKSD